VYLNVQWPFRALQFEGVTPGRWVLTVCGTSFADAVAPNPTERFRKAAFAATGMNTIICSLGSWSSFSLSSVGIHREMSDEQLQCFGKRHPTAIVSPIATCHFLLKEIVMNWDRIEGNWKQLKGKTKEQWGKLTDDDFDVIAGRRDQLAGKIQERYGVAKDEAERQVSDWERRADESWFVRSDRPLN
jgi:uncharacterized protein YjbJ (UPF0337 family)